MELWFFDEDRLRGRNVVVSSKQEGWGDRSQTD
jgi:hypothetical protein